MLHCAPDSFHYIFVYTATINITGNTPFQLGETSEITCFIPAQVESIQWLDQYNGIVREGMSVQRLALNITITAAHNNTNYTCTCKVRAANGRLRLIDSQTIIVKTEGNKIIHLNN